MQFYAQGSALLTENELIENQSKITKFYKGLAGEETPPDVEFSNGTLSAENVIVNGTLSDENPVPFKPVAQGKPLTIMLTEVYTGKYPEKKFLSGRKDMLITSALKSISTYEAKPRAINYLKENVTAGSHYERPGASESGTPLLFYSPALMDESLTLDLSMVFDQFPDKVFNQVSKAFQSAAGIPVFISASMYLMAASAITKIIGQAGEAIFDGKPSFETTEALNIQLPGAAPLQPGFVLCMSDDTELPDNFLDRFQLNSFGKLVDKSGKKYKEDIPYMVICIDGTEHKEFEKFTPTAAGTAILSRFYGLKDGESQPVDLLIEAFKVYNDVHYRQQIQQIDTEISQAQDQETKNNLKKKRDALSKNILTDILKVS